MGFISRVMWRRLAFCFVALTRPPDVAAKHAGSALYCTQLGVVCRTEMYGTDVIEEREMQ
jgi:hypothetical protein